MRVGKVCCISTAMLFAWAPLALAHEGDHAVQAFVRQNYSGPSLLAGAPESADAIEQIVVILTTVHGSTGDPFFPQSLALRSVSWSDDIAVVRFTLPDGCWTPSPTDFETLSRALALPFLADPAFAGLRIEIRKSTDADWQPLHEFVRSACAPDVDEPPRGDAQPSAEVTLRTHHFPPPAARNSPIANATRQPIGALTGVTVYVGAGHGWTAGASAWALQRPITQGMNEDYGNVDQLNNFCAFAFNAGATVVPLRPAGWQPIQIVIDQDDPAVSYAGSWSDSANPQYYENNVTTSGVAYRFSNAAATESATARYNATIGVTDYYPVYAFVVASTNRVRQTYRVRHNGGVSAITVNHRDVGNGWVWLGDYYLVAGEEGWVEISNESADSGVVIADAVRWGGGLGDINRPGPNSTSGYPRDEEAQRYWAQSELGNNAVGFDSTIWDNAGLADLDDNIGTGARLARNMNQVPPGGVNSERWKRIHIEFHTNAFDTTARGQLCLITDTGSTTNQALLATTLSNEIDADMLVLDDTFEHQWVDRASPTLTSSYGAISTSNNSNEFDATIVEFAFHDNAQDAQLLRDSRVRAAMGRACVQGVVRFLNGLAGSTVPLAFAPDTPRDVAVEDLGGGDIQVSWQPPLSDSARGDPATGYVVYQSANGYGFGDPIVLGNVLSTTISGVATAETKYFRVAATNAGGESMPSEVLAVRRPAGGIADVLIVQGFDRQRRQLNPVQAFTQPPAYAGLSIERTIWRASNAYDYVIQHAEALAAAGYGFASCNNEAVINNRVALTNYAVVDWMLGQESIEDETLSTVEQSLLDTYLTAGGAIFISGADIAFDLINQAGGPTFATTTLQIGYTGNDANTYNAAPSSGGGIFTGMAAFNFNPASGAAYDTREPDILASGLQGFACLNFTGGSTGIAGVQLSGTTHNAVTLAFPFEAISSPAIRAEMMTRVMNFLLTATGPIPFDFNNDGDVDFADFASFRFCLRGPDLPYAGGNFCLEFDGDGDDDVDILDFAQMELYFTGPLSP